MNWVIVSIDNSKGTGVLWIIALTGMRGPGNRTSLHPEPIRAFSAFAPKDALRNEYSEE
jgi:hypothetical protein